MCGITGFFSTSNLVNTSNYYDAHLLTKHRGPDDEGFVAINNNILQIFKGDDTISDFWKLDHIKNVAKSNLILGHRRLSIIDTSSAGHQPFIFRNLSLIYNGEIYNFNSIKKLLIEKGYQFTTKTDTEVIIKGYHCWGKELLNKLNGMWAFAIYDSDKQTMTLARDRFGIKPLYYSINSNSIYFASEMKFILNFKDIKYTINKKSVNKYLHNATINDSEQTIWNEILELEPGSCLTFSSSGTQYSEYWSMTDKVASEKISEEDALEEFEYLFEDSLRLRLISDVEVGSLLSGGLDSTTIVSTLFNKNMVSKDVFNTYSAIFDEEEYSEEKYIRETINKYDINSSFTYPDVNFVKNYINKIQYHIEDPFRSLSVFSQFSIYENISNNYKTKVLLNGQGSDELFSGYSYHYYPFFIELLKQLKLNSLVKEVKLWKQYRKASITQVSRQIIYYLIKYPFSLNLLRDLSINEVSKTPLREYLKYDDRTSMAFGLESRVPFLDHRLVELSIKLKSHSRIKDFTNKKIVRDYAQDKIPKSILERKDKQGFVSPQELWQRKEMKSDMDKVFSEISKNDLLGYIPGKTFFDTYSEYQNHKHNNRALVWRIYNLNLWYKQWCQ